MSDLAEQLAELLRDMRHQTGLTQLALAHRLGHADASHVGRCENGHRTPKPELIGRWAAACGYQAELRVHQTPDLYWLVELNGDEGDL